MRDKAWLGKSDRKWAWFAASREGKEGQEAQGVGAWVRPPPRQIRLLERHRVCRIDGICCICHCLSPGSTSEHANFYLNLWSIALCQSLAACCGHAPPCLGTGLLHQTPLIPTRLLHVSFTPVPAPSTPAPRLPASLPCSLLRDQAGRCRDCDPPRQERRRAVHLGRVGEARYFILLSARILPPSIHPCTEPSFKGVPYLPTPHIMQLSPCWSSLCTHHCHHYLKPQLVTQPPTYLKP